MFIEAESSRISTFTYGSFICNSMSVFQNHVQKRKRCFYTLLRSSIDNLLDFM